MRVLGLIGFLVVFLAVGCGGDDGGPPSVQLIAEPTTFASGGTTNLTIRVENFELRQPTISYDIAGLASAHGGTPTEGTPELVTNGGHYHIYMNTTLENPLVHAWAPTIALTVDGEPGPHTLIVRLNADDHRFLNPEIKDEVEIVLQ